MPSWGSISVCVCISDVGVKIVYRCLVIQLENPVWIIPSPVRLILVCIVRSWFPFPCFVSPVLWARSCYGVCVLIWVKWCVSCEGVCVRWVCMYSWVLDCVVLWWFNWLSCLYSWDCCVELGLLSVVWVRLLMWFSPVCAVWVYNSWVWVMFSCSAEYFDYGSSSRSWSASVWGALFRDP